MCGSQGLPIRKLGPDGIMRCLAAFAARLLSPRSVLTSLCSQPRGEVSKLWHMPGPQNAATVNLFAEPAGQVEGRRRSHAKPRSIGGAKSQDCTPVSRLFACG